MQHLKQKTFIQILLIAGAFVLVVWLSALASESEAISNITRSFGYPGVFVLAIVSGFNLLVPIPIIAFLPLFTAAGLNFWWTVVVIALGMSLGDGLGYLVGSVGRKALHAHGGEHAVFNRLERFQKKNFLAPLVAMLLYAAFVPAPNEILVIPLSFMGYKLSYVLTVVFVGNLVFNTLVAIGIMTVL